MRTTIVFCLLIAAVACRPADEKKVDKTDEVKKTAEVKSEAVTKKEDVKVAADEPKKEEVKEAIVKVAADAAKDVMKEGEKVVSELAKDAKPEEVAAADATKVEEVKTEEVKTEEVAKQDATAETTSEKPVRGLAGLFNGIRRNAASFANRINPFNRRRAAVAATETKVTETKEENAKPAQEESLPILPPKENRNVRRSITGVVKTMAKEILPVIGQAVEAYVASQSL